MWMAVIVPLLLGFFSPLFLISLFVSYMLSATRIDRERHQFRVAVNKKMVDFKQYFAGLPLGILISVVILFAGILFPGEWLVAYLILGTIFVATLCLNGLLPIISFSILGLLYAFFNEYFVHLLKPIWQFFQVSPVTGVENVGLFSGILFIFTGLMMFWLAYQEKKQETIQFVSPRLKEKKRGGRFAAYLYQSLYFVPILFVVPGEVFGSTLAWWPTISFGHETFALMCVPMIFGFRFKVRVQKLFVAQEKYRKDMQISGIVAIILGVITFFLPAYAGYGFILLLLLGIVIIMRHYLREKGDDQYTETKEGLRIIGIQPDTPAAKLSADIGDIIVECNHEVVHSEAMLHEALLKNSAYCHVKLLSDEGEFKVSETAVYEDSPHNLGFVLFPDETPLSSGNVLASPYLEKKAAEKAAKEKALAEKNEEK